MSGTAEQRIVSMPWMPLAPRLDSLPLIIAGPILRRVEATSVTVWLAFRAAQQVTLKVYAQSPTATMLCGSARTYAIGQHLHIVAVTATGTTPLQAGQVYTYNIKLQDGRDLTSSGVFQTPSYACKIAYDGIDLPSFALPPDNLQNLRILHGSCRKPHGEGRDAMPAIDTIIANSATDANKRPHQLFLTGDQIYADDVADGLLVMLQNCDKTLLGWSEQLPGITSTTLNRLLPGYRVPLTREIGFTSSLEDDDLTAKSHLMSLGEFLAMYLFVWSDVLWPPDLPVFKDVFPSPYTDKKRKSFNKEIGYLTTFRQDIVRVRRLLANVPSYMIADDHEVTDDWFINLHWTKQVIKNPLARRVVQNGLIGIAICQMWGNTPAAFSQQVPASPGQQILQALEDLNANHGVLDSARRTLSYALGLPFEEDDVTTFCDDLDQNRYMQHQGSHPWQHALPLHFHIAWSKHEVIGLDTRTWRGFSRKSDSDYPSLLSTEGLQKQILDSTIQPDHEISIVLVPGPLVGVPLIDWLQETSSNNKRLDRDSEAWGLQHIAFERFFAHIARRRAHENADQRIVLLCGDVHYGYTIRMQYWADSVFETQHSSQAQAIFAQLTASSFRNETKGSWFLNLKGTKFLHREGYKPLVDSIPIISPLLIDHQLDPKQILGWENPDKRALEIGTASLAGIPFLWFIDGDNPALANAQGPTLATDTILKKRPDWRYRIDYLLADYELDGFTPVTASAPTGSHQQALKEYMRASENHDDYAKRWGNGKEIVGLNNFGEVTFQWNPAQPRTVTHQIWWRLEKKGKDAAELEPFPLSKYVVSLEFDDAKYPKPRPEI